MMILLTWPWRLASRISQWARDEQEYARIVQRRRGQTLYNQRNRNE